MTTWMAGEALAGIVFLGVCLIRRRLSYWPVIVMFLLGDLMRGFGDWWGGINPGAWGGGYSGALPFPVGVVLFVVYASFASVPLAILIYTDRLSAKAAGVTVLVDGLIHLLLPVQPPWMVGAATRWGASHRIIGSTLGKDVNPLAAFPSLHVALPASQPGRWRLWALGISVAVVMLGEHWVIDVAAGWTLALTCRWAVGRWWPEVRPVDVPETIEALPLPEAEPAAA